jgi:HSP20 family protein
VSSADLTFVRAVERPAAERAPRWQSMSKEKSIMSTALSSRLAEGFRPGRDLFASLQREMDEMLHRFSTEMNGGPAGALVPSLDLSETENKVQLRVDLPGMKPEDVNIEVVGNEIRIRGERKEEKEEKGKTFHRIERRTGTFYRATSLPCAVDDAKAEAEYADGVLTITLPKSAEAKTKRIKIKAT